MPRFLKMKSLAACALMGVILSPLSAVAFTVGIGELPSRVVGYSDLDLSRDVGVAALYSRIKSAAREVCDPLDVWTLRLLRQKVDCREAAIGRAVADVNSPALTSYFLMKTKTTAPAIEQR